MKRYYFFNKVKKQLDPACGFRRGIRVGSDECKNCEYAGKVSLYNISIECNFKPKEKK